MWFTSGSFWHTSTELLRLCILMIQQKDNVPTLGPNDIGMTFSDHTCYFLGSVTQNPNRLHVRQYLLHQELVGCVGAAGDVGATGAVGAAEATGAVGAAGATGAVGAAGATIAAGAMGAKGDMGVAGAMGVTGAMGAVRAMGAAGATGAMGAAGAMGVTDRHVASPLTLHVIVVYTSGSFWHTSTKLLRLGILMIQGI